MIKIFSSLLDYFNKEEDIPKISRRYFIIGAGLALITPLVPTNLIEEPSNSDIIALELEKIRHRLPLLFERDDYFFNLIESREVEKVSSRTIRFPLSCELVRH